MEDLGQDGLMEKGIMEHEYMKGMVINLHMIN